MWQAVCLVNRGAGEPGQQTAHVAAVRKHLDRGLDELAGGDALALAQGRALRQILNLMGTARSQLAACERALAEWTREGSFANPGLLRERGSSDA